MDNFQSGRACPERSRGGFIHAPHKLSAFGKILFCELSYFVGKNRLIEVFAELFEADGFEHGGCGAIRIP